MSEKESSELEGMDPREVQMVASWLKEDGGDSQDSEPDYQESQDREVEQAELEEEDVDWQSKVRELERERNGILNDLQNTREQFRRERAENAERTRRLDERLNALQEAFSGPKSQEPELPDPDEDPLAHLAHQQGLTQRQLKEIKDRLDQEQQMKVASANNQAEMATIAAAEKQYLESSDMDLEEYDDALEFTRERMSNYFKMQGFNDQEVAFAIGQQEVAFARRLLQLGQNPAEKMVDFARNLGWAGPSNGEQSKPNKSGENNNTNKGRFQPDPKVSASKSLSSVGGSSASGHGVSLDDLDNLSEEQLEKIMADPKLWRKFNMGEKIRV